jgi:nickel superoxide dismutase
MKMNLKKMISALTLVIVFMGINVQKSFAHCEIPCGIYADSMRISMILEDITTIEKSMNEIEEISKSATPNYNQLVRWINNKDVHADKIQEIVTQYFLTQRIKPVPEGQDEAYKKYQLHLELLHKMLVYAMKCKQTTDLANVEALRTTIADFEKAYFHKH